MCTLSYCVLLIIITKASRRSNKSVSSYAVKIVQPFSFFFFLAPSSNIHIRVINAENETT